MIQTSRRQRIAVLATLGLASLPSLPQGTALVAAGTATAWAETALASTAIPGVGVIIKRKPGNAPIVAPADANGELRISDLQPGEYLVRVIGGRDETPVRVGSDGRLALVVREQASGPRAAAEPERKARPVQAAIPLSIVQLAANGPCRPPYLCDFVSAAKVLDINAASDKELGGGTLNSSDAIRVIIGERQRSGPFSDVIDFAQRICSKTDVDFDDLPIRVGETSIVVRRGGDPKSAGFKCARGTGEFQLFSSKHNYVGHVTLLR